MKDFLEGTLATKVLEADERLGCCARCPKTGGACAEAPHEGQLPRWLAQCPPSGNPALGWAPCPRWPAFRVDQRLLHGGFPALLVRATIDSLHDPSPATAVAQRLCRAFVVTYGTPQGHGRGLALDGTPGVGKTHLAVAVCRQLYVEQRLRDARFWDTAELLDHLRPSAAQDRHEVLARTCHAPLLVLDDLDAIKPSEWVREQLGIVINYRWRTGLPTILTSNAPLALAAAPLGERITSRLLALCPDATLEGVDQRQRRRSRS